MPGARIAPQPRVVCEINAHELVTTVTPESPGNSPRKGFNGFFALLPSDRAFLPLSSAESLSSQLTPASGVRDHMTSPSKTALRQ